ncbi:hypothetical protein R1flu_017665 [Riccia fluitans]|uniref:Uncharacterized protein n=1 Tax=Riccia fluitans TaxID=41844 RepID=A0ABD1ZEN4_9MARC
MSMENAGSEQWSENKSKFPEFTADHGTYKLSPGEERDARLACQRQLRRERLQQVRAQEMLLAEKSAIDYRQRRKREGLKLLQSLKEAWQEDQEIRKAVLEFDYFHSCEGIGQSHVVAQHLTERLDAQAVQKAKEAQLNEIRGNLRFRRAMKEEKAGKSEVSKEKILAKCRREVLKRVSETERRMARSHACRVKSRSKDKDKDKPKVPYEELATERYLKIDSRLNSVLHYQLPGAPNDYKDTYFHSRFSVLKDRERKKKATDKEDTQAEENAWEAAAGHVKLVETERERKALLEEIWKRRQEERSRKS